MVEDEAQRQLDLRIAAFRRAGFAEVDARALAANADIRYLDALALVRQGFPPELVVSMLGTGQRPVF